MKSMTIFLLLSGFLLSSAAEAQRVTVRGLKKWTVDAPSEISNPYQKTKCDRGDELEIIEYTTNGALSGYQARGNTCTVLSSWIAENGSLSPSTLKEFGLRNGGISLSAWHGCVAAINLDCR